MSSIYCVSVVVQIFFSNMYKFPKDFLNNQMENNALIFRGQLNRRGKAIKGSTYIADPYIKLFIIVKF